MRAMARYAMIVEMIVHMIVEAVEFAARTGVPAARHRLD
jgi:hypothetical protein